MKKVFFLCMMFAIVCMMTSCNSDSPSSSGIDATINVSANGGSYEYSLDASGWSIENPNDTEWCQPQISASKFMISVQPNFSHDVRYATFRLNNADNQMVIKVNQDPKADVTIEETVPIIDKSGGTINIPIKSNVDFSVNVPDIYSSWVKASISRSSSIKVTVSANDGAQARSAIIEILDKSKEILITINITQKGNQPKNTIYYTTTNNGKVIPSTSTSAYGPGFAILSNTYTDGQGTIIFDGDITQINAAFKNKVNLKTISLPDGITVIGKNAFYGCTSLESIMIPEAVTKIGDSAFENCSNLVSINIPSKLHSIGSKTFSNCSSIESLFLPNTLNQIGSSAFYRCISLSSLVIPKNTELIGGSCFYGVQCEVSFYIKEDYDIPKNIFEGFKGYFKLPKDNGENSKLFDFARNHYAYARKDTYFSGPYASEDGRCLIVNGTLYMANICNFTERDYYFPKGIKKTVPYAILHDGAPKYPYCIHFEEGLEEISADFISSNNNTSLYRWDYYEVFFPSTLKKMTNHADIKYPLFSAVWINYKIHMPVNTPPLNEFDYDYNDFKYEFYVPANSVEAYKQAWPHLAHWIFSEQ